MYHGVAAGKHLNGLTVVRQVGLEHTGFPIRPGNRDIGSGHFVPMLGQF
jgi:hypothetical protein